MADVTALVAAWAVVFVAGLDLSSATLRIATLSVLASMVMLNAQGLYLSRVCSVRTVELARLVSAQAFAAVGTAGIIRLLEADVAFSTIVLAASAEFGALLLGRGAFRAWLSHQRTTGRFTRPVLLVGTNGEARQLLDLVSQHPELGLRIVGVVGNPAEAAIAGIDPDLHVGPIAALNRELTRTSATGVLIAVSAIRSDELNDLIGKLSPMGVHIQLTSGLRGIDHRRLRSQVIASEPLYYIERPRLAQWQVAAKRVLDLAVGTTVLVLSAPLVLQAMVLIKLRDGGPIFHREHRVGRDEELITVLRLRTTAIGHSPYQPGNVSVWHDPSLTRLGRVLEATSLNEVPQLWSVVRGDLSLVGPRPPLASEVMTGRAPAPAVRPGVTGLWKTEDRSPALDDHIRLDRFYVDNWSFALDLVVLAATVEPILARIVYGASERRRPTVTAREPLQA